jgi:acyl dehydratase
MKMPAGLVGATAGPRHHEIDARWLMAYAAALGESGPEYLDTTREQGLTAHPLFPVCYEWPLALDLRDATVSSAIADRSVHATHDLVLHRLPRAGDRLDTTAVITAAEPRRPGTYVVTRFETRDEWGRPVSTTDYGSIYRGVGCDETPPPSGRPGPGRSAGVGERRREAGAPEAPPDWSIGVAIAPTLAHVYTECARIWNPVHTDRAVARAAGLPDIILHGTATLGLAVSRVLGREPAGAAARVTRIACRFSGMVRMPSRITVQGWSARPHPPGRAVDFRVLAEDGGVAVRDGVVVLAA